MIAISPSSKNMIFRVESIIGELSEAIIISFSPTPSTKALPRLAAIILSFLTYLIDIKHWKKPFWFFEVFGTNSIFLFIISGLWVKTILNIDRELDGNMVNAYHYLYKTVFVPMAGDLNGSLLFALSHVLGFWCILYWMHKKNIQIKL